MSTELRVELPKPDRYLTPNCVTGDSPQGVWRMHCAHIGQKKKAKDDATKLAKEALLAAGLRSLAPVEYELHWFYHGPKADADNCLASCKAYLDGCATAFGSNDRDWDCAGVRRLPDAARKDTILLIFRTERKDNDLQLY